MCVCTGGPLVVTRSGLGLWDPGSGTQSKPAIASHPWEPEGKALAEKGSVSCFPPCPQWWKNYRSRS